MVVTDVIDYLSRLMLVSGLEKDLQLDVAKSSATTLEEMVEVAKKLATAFTAVRRGKKLTKTRKCEEADHSARSWMRDRRERRAPETTGQRTRKRRPSK